MPKISIIIPTLTEAQYLEATLQNFNTLAIPHEIIVTDGGSTDGTLEIARRYTQKVVVWDRAAKGRRQNFGEAKNAGAKIATGEFLVFIDADVIVPDPQDFFTELLAEFSRKPNFVATTVQLMPRPGYAWLRDYFFVRPLNWWYLLSNNVFHYGNASGEFQMMRKTTFEKVGGYREDLRGGEDTDMFNRLAYFGRTHSHWHLKALHTCRRPHKTGWLKLYWMWMRQGLYVLVLGHSVDDEWSVVR
jgi:glycosyltransferase involved in cell wall biosynthesis